MDNLKSLIFSTQTYYVTALLYVFKLRNTKLVQTVFTNTVIVLAFFAKN